MILFYYENIVFVIHNLIELLKKPENYPHKPENIQLLQTHASYVFIAKPYVYKIKKPVQLGFLDFSSLKKRFFYSLQEIQLNMRLCEKLYIGLVRIVFDQSINKFTIEHLKSSDEIVNIPPQEFDELFSTFSLENTLEKNTNISVEFAIKMYYIEDKYFLKNQNITYDILQKITDKLVFFYQSLPSLQNDYSKKNIFENLKDCEIFVNDILPFLMYRFIKKFKELYFKKYNYKLLKRIQDGWIKNCHGDLHLEHIINYNDSICIYDCIEFNHEFREIDIANDIAFLCMDLEFHGYYHESYNLIKMFFRKFDNYDLIFLQDLYRSYRAFVRGKVYSIKSKQEGISTEEWKESRELARKYFNLSFLYALKGIHPTLLVFMGRIGSGKSTLARKFASLINANVYSSDVTRKTFFNLPLYERTPDHLKEKVYSSLITMLVYKKIVNDGIHDSLKHGIGIVDGVFAFRVLRNIALFRAFEENVKVIFIEIAPEKELILKRLEKRQLADNEVSDAGIKEFIDFYDLYEPPNEIPKNQKITIKIKKDRDIDTILSFLLKKILIHRFQYKYNY